MTYDEERTAAAAFLLAVDAAMQIAQRQREVSGYMPQDTISAGYVIDSHPAGYDLRNALALHRDAEQRS